MGAFNVVLREVSERCDRCGEEIVRSLEFKFGQVWQHHYSIGDRLRWGAPQVGIPGYKLVEVPGFGERCPRCGAEPQHGYLILVQDDVVTKTDIANFNAGEEVDYRVIEA